MRLVDFLILLLTAQAQTLQRLAALFGEDILLQMLENTEEPESEGPEGKIEGESARAKLNTVFTEAFEISGSPAKSTSRGTHFQRSPYGNAYAELEGSIKEIPLPAVLEFHLWAYPFYRSFIESGLELESRFKNTSVEASTRFADECIAQADFWIKKLPIAQEFSTQAEHAARIPWLKFRTQVLKQIGHRPLGAI